MDMEYSLMQSQLKLNSGILRIKYTHKRALRLIARTYKVAKNHAEAEYCYKKLDKLTKEIKRLEQVQKALKEDMRGHTRHMRLVNRMIDIYVE
jgi:hypothetical protein